MKSIAILTSGGDCQGMNACIRAVVKYGISEGLLVYGIKRGYAGLVDDDMELMTKESVDGIIETGGTILKTARCKEFLKEEVVDQAAENLKKRGIEGLVVIGGDGTFKGAKKLIKRGILCACIPGTIDNNLFYTDYTIGFDTATNIVVDLVGKVKETSASHDRYSIVEVMGAGCGDIALKAGLAAGADLVVVPEKPYTNDEICAKLSAMRASGKRTAMIIVSEHITDTYQLAKIITEKCGIECRTTIIGHIQRGGSPTLFDRNLATNYGVRAVKELLAGNCGVTGYKNGKYIYVTIDEALDAKQEFNDYEYNLIEKLGN